MGADEIVATGLVAVVLAAMVGFVGCLVWWMVRHDDEMGTT